jgi:hypothetical protein
MSNSNLSRRDFLKLAALGAASVAASSTRLPKFNGLASTVRGAAGVLSDAQQRRLAAAARKFIAPTIETARAKALEVDFIEGRNEDASTMCGPLAIAMLQSADLLGPWASRHDFWLLNPKVDLEPVRNTFPESVYDWHQYTEPLSKFDFTKEPLQAGDMLYLHAGLSGTYEHVLVVSRVDDAGRAYSVTNFFTATGTIIEERMLYDPSQPGVGQFYDWANRSIRNTMGNTGDGGFWLWRVKDGRSLEFPTDAASTQLRTGLDALLLPVAGTWHASIQQFNGDLLYQFDPYVAFHPASTIKVPIAMAFFHWLENENVTSWNAYLADHGVKRRSYAQLLEAMLVDSEEDATQVLVDYLGKPWLDDLWESWGLPSTRIDPRRSSASDTLAALHALYAGELISAPARAYILDLMGTYTSNDDARLGLLRPQLPAATRIYNKRGSLVEWPRVVADSGILQLPGAGSPAYIFSLHGIGKNEAGYDDLEVTFDQAIAIFGEFLQAQLDA